MFITLGQIKESILLALRALQTGILGLVNWINCIESIPHHVCHLTCLDISNIFKHLALMLPDSL